MGVQRHMGKWTYDAAHHRLRAQWKPAVDRGEVLCGACGRPIVPGTPWHLGHSADRSSAVPWHRLCNLQDAQAKAARTRSYKREPEKHPPYVKP